MPDTERSNRYILVKLGGSLITDKRKDAALRAEVLTRLAQELANAAPADGAQLILGHGSGSFGHVAAAKYGLDAGLQPGEPLAGVSETQGRAAELHRHVVAALRQAGATPFSIAPSSSLITHHGRTSRYFYEPIQAALELGLLPVVYGDVVLDSGQGVAIASTETVFSALARRLHRRESRIDRILWLGETPGVYDSEGKTLPLIAPGNLTHVRTLLGDAAGTDVTGGVRHRIQIALTLARKGIPSLLVDGREPGLVAKAVAGEEVPGTWVRV